MESIEEQMKERAKMARANAYAPYSQFPVGAALLTDDGEIYGGCNVENASYPMGFCAERSCVAQAVAAGHRNFSAIWVMGADEAPMPCGACRQVLSEFGDLKIFVASHNGADVQMYWLHDLLPHSFQMDAQRKT